MRRTLLERSASSMTSQLGTHYKDAILLFTSDCKTSEWRGKLNLKKEVLCCRRPNKVSCRNHSNTPGISMHTFPKEAKRKQNWMTFARIHRLVCQWNTLSCALSILKHRVSAEVCLLGHQCISRGFTLRKVQYHQYTESRKIHWTLFTQEMRKDLQIDSSRKTFFGRFFGTLPRNVSIQRLLPPPQKKKFLFGLGRPI